MIFSSFSVMTSAESGAKTPEPKQLSPKTKDSTICAGIGVAATTSEPSNSRSVIDVCVTTYPAEQAASMTFSSSTELVSRVTVFMVGAFILCIGSSRLFRLKLTGGGLACLYLILLG